MNYTGDNIAICEGYSNSYEDGNSAKYFRVIEIDNLKDNKEVTEKWVISKHFGPECN